MLQELEMQDWLIGILAAVLMVRHIPQGVFNILIWTFVVASGVKMLLF